VAQWGIAQHTRVQADAVRIALQGQHIVEQDIKTQKEKRIIIDNAFSFYDPKDESVSVELYEAVKDLRFPRVRISYRYSFL
jgi:hypothetical protein